MRDQSRAVRLRYVEQAIAAKQNNIVWPGPLINSKAVDQFLWRGSSDPSAVQRVGAWLFGLVFVTGGVSLLTFGLEERSILLAAISAGSILVGLRVFRNGFRRAKPRNNNERGEAVALPSKHK
jgi:hypothetical protein